jgi:hypothetical protein
VRNPEIRRKLERPRHGWDDNFKMDEAEWGSMDLVGLVQDSDRKRATVNMVTDVKVKSRFVAKSTWGIHSMNTAHGGEAGKDTSASR